MRNYMMIVSDLLHEELEASSVEDVELMTETKPTPTMTVQVYSVEFVDCEGDVIEGAVIRVKTAREVRYSFEAGAQHTDLLTANAGRGQ